MAGTVAPVADEREGLIAYLRQMRYVLELTAYGLTDDQARATLTTSPLSVGGLIKHVARTESGWVDVILQQPSGEVADYADGFTLRPDERPEDYDTR